MDMQAIIPMAITIRIQKRCRMGRESIRRYSQRASSACPLATALLACLSMESKVLLMNSKALPWCPAFR